MHKELSWFSEEEKRVLPKVEVAYIEQDGEYGGHVPFLKVRNDDSFLLTKEERENIWK